MIQTQTLPQVLREKGIYAYYRTWGSCKEYNYYIVLPDGTKIGPEHLRSYRNQKTVRTIRGSKYVVRIEVDNNDSAKNANRYGYIIDIQPEMPPFVIWVSDSQVSCAHHETRAKVITRDGREIDAEFYAEEEEYEKENSKYRYKIRKIARYIVFNLDDQEYRIPFDVKEEVVDKQIIPEKASIVAKVKGTRIEVSGDTYHVRDILKSLRFRWDWLNKVWYTECSSDDDVGYTLLELEAQLKERGFSLVIENASNA